MGTVCSTCFDRCKEPIDRCNEEEDAMALKSDTKLKLAAGVYGDFVTNEDVGNSQPKFGYKPSLGDMTHEEWVTALLSGDANSIRTALAAVDVVDDNDLAEVIDTLKKTDREVALAIYKKLRADILLHRPKAGGAGGDASSHDY
jgi:hypothetical protein